MKRSLSFMGWARCALGFPTIVGIVAISLSWHTNVMADVVSEKTAIAERLLAASEPERPVVATASAAESGPTLVRKDKTSLHNLPERAYNRVQMSINWGMVEAVGVFGQFIVVFVASFLALWQLKHMRRQNELEASLPILGWIRSAEYQEAYPLLLAATEKSDSAISIALANADSADPGARAVLTIAHFLNEIGILVEKDLIKGSTIIPYYRDTIVMTWSLIVPFVVRRRREEHGSSFFVPLEALVLLARSMSSADRFASVRRTLPRPLRPAFDDSLAITRSPRTGNARPDT